MKAEKYPDLLSAIRRTRKAGGVIQFQSEGLSNGTSGLAVSRSGPSSGSGGQTSGLAVSRSGPSSGSGGQTSGLTVSRSGPSSGSGGQTSGLAVSAEWPFLRLRRTDVRARGVTEWPFLRLRRTDVRARGVTVWPFLRLRRTDVRARGVTEWPFLRLRRTDVRARGVTEWPFLRGQTSGLAVSQCGPSSGSGGQMSGITVSAEWPFLRLWRTDVWDHGVSRAALPPAPEDRRPGSRCHRVALPPALEDRCPGSRCQQSGPSSGSGGQTSGITVSAEWPFLRLWRTDVRDHGVSRVALPPALEDRCPGSRCQQSGPSSGSGGQMSGITVSAEWPFLRLWRTDVWDHGVSRVALPPALEDRRPGSQCQQSDPSSGSGGQTSGITVSAEWPFLRLWRTDVWDHGVSRVALPPALEDRRLGSRCQQSGPSSCSGGQTSGITVSAEWPFSGSGGQTSGIAVSQSGPSSCSGRQTSGITVSAEWPFLWLWRTDVWDHGVSRGALPLEPLVGNLFVASFGFWWLVFLFSFFIFFFFNLIRDRVCLCSPGWSQTPGLKQSSCSVLTKCCGYKRESWGPACWCFLTCGPITAVSAFGVTWPPPLLEHPLP
ncbi:LOW QUALITY PROTEIN: uncharacterized protein LOC112205022 [Pan troglodytes]|uniref:LOW QUALITY PROTEIN: uncharacterized protein LOC112205022 n=1 Tax=Pan troglodytes TaxID=9598 RepID=UPI0030136098